MSVVTIVKANDHSLKNQRETAAKRVLEEFATNLPDLRLLCYLDDQNWPPFKADHGESNRGFFTPLKKNTATAVWPSCVMEHMIDSLLKPRCDCIIYLHGSTCNVETGLIMTLAHEIQHFVQYGHNRPLWAVNTLITNLLVTLPLKTITDMGLGWCDVPIELEARSVAKGITEKLCGVDRTQQFIGQKLEESQSTGEKKDWNCVQTLIPFAPFDLADHTRILLRRLDIYKDKLQTMLRNEKSDPDFKDIDLSDFN